jgi:hypothetical protein
MPVDLESVIASLGAHGVTGARVALGAGVFVATLFGSLLLAAAVIVRLPPTYFQEKDERDRHPARRAKGLRILRAIGKNLAGLVLVAVGIVLSLPGIPGQGIFTVLIGLMLLDIPGKKRLERKIVSHPKVLTSMNRLRSRYHREPLRL